jgi:hypothetical protein
MSTFLEYLEAHYVGVIVLFSCLAVTVLLIQWLVWIFARQRFGYMERHSTRISYVIADFFVKIIDDFRHLLALVIVIIFAAVLLYGMIRAGADLERMTKVLQAVVSTLGGLIGSIIGYYFGESAARRAVSPEPEPLPQTGEVEQAPAAGAEDIRPVPPAGPGAADEPEQ